MCQVSIAFATLVSEKPVKRIIRLFALASLPVSVLYGDWKIVTRTGDSSVTEFFKGELVRTDSSPAYTTVMDFNHRQQVAWRSDLRQYVIIQWPPALQSDLPPASVITIERNTTDTGQRKQFFGRTARHLVTHVTRSDGPETTIDGWYIDAPGFPKRKSGAGASLAILTTSVGGQKLGPPKIEVKQTGPVPEGLAVWQKTTSSIVLPGGSRQDSERVTEVSDLMEGTLADKLFQPPDGYQHVASLPDTAADPVPRTLGGLLQAHWHLMKDWFSTLF
jgi:hypothetical protein